MKFPISPLKKNTFFLFLLSVFLGSGQLVAQQKTPVIDVAKILLTDTIDYRSICYQDSLHTVNFSQLPGVTFKAPPKNIFRHVSSLQTAADWWLCFRLTNSADTLINVYFFPGVYVSTIDMYAYNDSLKTVEPSPVILPAIPDSAGYRGIRVSPGHTVLYYAHLKFVHTNVNAMDVRLIRDYYLLHYTKSLKMPLNNSNMYTYVITGILLMMIFYSMAVFILNGSIEFMYYACFSLFTGLLFFLKSFYTKSTVEFNYYFESYLDFIIQSLGVFFYYIFLRKFPGNPQKLSFPV